MTYDTPIEAKAFEHWLAMMLMLRGPDMLRVKGIANLVGCGGPTVIHGVQQIVHPPIVLDRWPSADRRTRLVFITRNIDRRAIEDTLGAFARGGARAGQ